MDWGSFVKSAVDLGMIAVFALMFWRYISDRGKYRDKLLEEQYKNSENRESLIRNEAADRERIFREDADRRERQWLAMFNNLSATMERVADTLEEFKTAMNFA
jgi:hypothetical protein